MIRDREIVERNTFTPADHTMGQFHAFFIPISILKSYCFTKNVKGTFVSYVLSSNNRFAIKYMITDIVGT